ncbi:hypothetical protein V502_00257 [Pseudogymnoascus sp. VKM F-4520 (FW-2644)]|nr:hypothetical protein V502_00257 [Pseudogymnoascus sp. VKM F-4520 (FW-2644)]
MPQPLFLPTMGYIRAAPKAYTEDDTWKAINACKDKQFPSLIAATAHFGVPYSTARDRIAGRKAKAQAHESAQLLSNAEEKTLVRWISRLPSMPGCSFSKSAEIHNPDWLVTPLLSAISGKSVCYRHILQALGELITLLWWIVNKNEENLNTSESSTLLKQEEKELFIKLEDD